MAKSSDELERELELKRQQLHARTNKLRTRVADNVRGIRTQTQEELSGYRDKAELQVSDHPWLALAGGFGGGIALGIAKGGGSSSHKASANGASEDHGETLLSRGVGALFSATGGPVFNEVRDTLQDTLSELKDTLQDSVSDVVHGIIGTSTGQSNVSAVEHRQRVRDHVTA